MQFYQLYEIFLIATVPVIPALNHLKLEHVLISTNATPTSVA